MVLGVSVAVQGLLSAMGQLTGGTDDIQSVIMTPFAILFDKVEATKIDLRDYFYNNKKFV